MKFKNEGICCSVHYFCRYRLPCTVSVQLYVHYIMSSIHLCYKKSCDVKMPFLKKNFSKLNNSTIRHCCDDIFQNFHTLTECLPLFLNVLFCTVDTSLECRMSSWKCTSLKKKRDKKCPISNIYFIL